jgi:hypothetical protein
VHLQEVSAVGVNSSCIRSVAIPICTENLMHVCYQRILKTNFAMEIHRRSHLCAVEWKLCICLNPWCAYDKRNISIHIMVLRTHLDCSRASCLLRFILFKLCEWKHRSSVCWNWLYVLLLLIVDYMCWILVVPLACDKLDISWKTVLCEESVAL